MTAGNGLRTFLFEAHTGDGCAVVGGGISLAAADAGGQELAASMARLTASAATDPRELDRLLASHVRAHCPAHVRVVGLSVCVPGCPGPAGGIVGSPHRQIGSADSMAEPIGSGFSVAAHPGGPGIALQGTPEQAQRLLDATIPGDGGMAVLEHLGQRAAAAGIRLAVMVADGTGSSRPGAVAALEGHRLRAVTAAPFSLAPGRAAGLDYTTLNEEKGQ